MAILLRIRAALSCLIFGHLPVPVSAYKIICIGDETLLLTNTNSNKSLEVALWALERPEHYWKATVLGKNTHDEALRTTPNYVKDEEY